MALSQLHQMPLGLGENLASGRTLLPPLHMGYCSQPPCAIPTLEQALLQQSLFLLLLLFPQFVQLFVLKPEELSFNPQGGRELPPHGIPSKVKLCCFPLPGLAPGVYSCSKGWAQIQPCKAGSQNQSTALAAPALPQQPCWFCSHSFFL